MSLLPPYQAGLTKTNVDNLHGFLQLEFDSDETIDHFHTQWWSNFHYVVDHNPWGPIIVNNKHAIVTGLLGLDVEHNGWTELHPVWAMAIRVIEALPIEVWAIFVRNWGNEGYCSRDQHYLNLPSDTFTFHLPWLPSASGVEVVGSATIDSTNVSTNFLANWDQSSWGMTPYVGEEVAVTFPLLPPKDCPRVNGQLVLQWSGENLQPWPQPERISSDLIAQPAGEDPAEQRLAAIYAQMTPAQKDSFDAAMKREPTPTFDEYESSRATLVPPAKSDVVPGVSAEYDARQAAKSEAQFELLKTIFGGAIPGIAPSSETSRGT